MTAGEPTRTRLIWLVRLALAAAIAVTLVFAMLPGDDHPRLLAWDKAEHFLAFTVIMLLALGAFPRTNPILLGGGAMVLGGIIEIAQATDWIGRDGDLLDLAPEAAAVATILLAVLLSRVRRWLVGTPT